MNNPSAFHSLLVPTDLSEASRDAFEWALSCIARNESVITVLHVLDEALIETIAAHHFAGRAEIAKRMRAHAEEQLSALKAAADEGVEVDFMIVEGRPFLEIIRKADDFAVDAIVMGRVGRMGHVEKLLFGSTAEKVLRGARRPVIVVPQADPS